MSANALCVSMNDSECGFHTSSLTNVNLGQKSFSHRWGISNFTKIMSWKSGNHLESSTFSIITKKCKLDWELSLYPNAVEDDVAYLYIFLLNKSYDSMKDDICVEISFSVLDAEGGIAVYKKLNQKTLDRTVRSWGCKIIQTSALKDRGLLVHDTLTLLAKITLVGDDVIVGGNGSSKKDQDAAASICRLSTDIESMLDTGRFSDCVIACGGQEFPCHKFILAARSSVFDAMFSHDMEEQIRNRVEIKDLDVNIVQGMIDYIYSGQVIELESKASGLITAAEKYDLQELKQMCVTSLCNGIRDDNVLDMLVLVETYDLPELRKSALEFTALHKKDVVNQEDWRMKLENYPGIIADMYEYDAKNM